MIKAPFVLLQNMPYKDVPGNTSQTTLFQAPGLLRKLKIAGLNVFMSRLSILTDLYIDINMGKNVSSMNICA